MRRLRPRHVFAASLVAASGVLCASGCADNDSSLFVRAVLLNKAPECVVKPDPSSTVLLGGMMDVALTDIYHSALLVGNQLVRRGAHDQLRTETSRISLRGAEIHVQGATGEAMRSFTVDGTGFVDPGSTAEPGYGVMYAPLIPPNTVGAGDDGRVITVRIRVFGETLGGTEIESNELFFPIRICNGCLVDYPADANISAPGQYQCGLDPTALGGTLNEDDIPCWPGQDQSLDCRFCLAYPVCSAPFNI